MNNPNISVTLTAHALSLAVIILVFLRAVPESEVAFLFKDAASAGELRPYADAINYNYRYIIMPMRI